MNIPIMLAFVTLVTLGTVAFFSKVAGANQVYGPSWIVIDSLGFCLAGIFIHLVQKHAFELSPRMTGLAVINGILGAIGVYAAILAFNLGGQGSIIFPLTSLGVVVSVTLSFIVFREPITATKLLGLGLGMSSIIVLSR